jgi:hypothetical protein
MALTGNVPGGAAPRSTPGPSISGFPPPETEDTRSKRGRRPKVESELSGLRKQSKNRPL